MPIPGAMPTAPFSQGIESLRGRKGPEAIRAAAREMESLFAYEMIKAMRSASGASAAGEGFGGDVYGTMFDMELARLMSSKGLGLQEMILKGMGQAAYSSSAASPPEFQPPSATAPETPVPTSAIGAGAPAAPVAPPAFAPHTRQPLEESVKMPAAAPPAASTTGPAPAPVPPETAAVPPGSGLHTHDSREGSGPFPSEEGALPIRDGGRVSSAFGYRKDPFTGAARFHHGIDIAASEGTEIYPVKSGEVTFAGYRKGYGNIVEVDHGGGLVTRYAHNRANRVAAGDRIGPNTVIAEVGSSGRSTGPHLHFEVHYEGQKVPPQEVFAGIAKGRG